MQHIWTRFSPSSQSRIRMPASECPLSLGVSSGGAIRFRESELLRMEAGWLPKTDPSVVVSKQNITQYRSFIATGNRIYAYLLILLVLKVPTGAIAYITADYCTICQE
jgi:hypothetical protein